MTSLAFLFVFAPLAVMSYPAEMKQEYFTTAIFPCDESEFNFTSNESISTKYWLLPNGDVITMGSSSGEHVSIDSNFTLTVNHIDDIDFGYYFCLLVRSDSTLDNIKYGLNTDGPYFGDLFAIYTKKAMIGGIAAGSLFVILAGFCLVSQLRYHKRNKRNQAVDELDKAIDGYDLRAYDNIALDRDEDSKKSSPRSADGYDLKAYGNIGLELDEDSKKSSPRSADNVANGGSPDQEEDHF